MRNLSMKIERRTEGEGAVYGREKKTQKVGTGCKN